MAGPQIIYQLASDSVINDTPTNKVSIIGIFQDIKIPSKNNSVILPMVVISRIERVPLKGNEPTVFKTEIFDPEGISFDSTSVSAIVPEAKINLISRFGAREFSKIGPYSCRVYLDGVEIKSPSNVIFTVKKIIK